MRVIGWGVIGVTVIALTVCLSSTQADDKGKKIPAEARALFGTFVSAFTREDAKGLARTFHEEEKVRLDIGSEMADYYGKAQATVLLKKYFEKVDVRSLELQDGKYTGTDDNPIAIYDYEYVQGEKKYQAVLTVSCLKVGAKWVIKAVNSYNK